ncbi:hypothetical protein Droror1_Dr00025616, partial [Drosera rotundifolia]
MRSMGMRTAMLTGDSQAAANHAQDQLGDALDEIQAGILPEQKAAIIQGYKNKVGLCGCGFCYVVDAEIMFDRRFKSQDNPLFNKLKALHGERSRLAQSFEYNYGDFIPVLRPFLRWYLKICKEVKEKRLQLFKDYFVDEHN